MFRDFQIKNIPKLTQKSFLFLFSSLCVLCAAVTHGGNHARCSTWGDPKTALAPQDRAALSLWFVISWKSLNQARSLHCKITTNTYFYCYNIIILTRALPSSLVQEFIQMVHHTPMLGDRVSAANKSINQTNYELFLTFFLKERSPIFNGLLRPQPIFS